nr:retrovirus-related Pol polyprotein from transposon TNT 1-94 [Tanacetum cinerariifolium]
MVNRERGENGFVAGQAALKAESSKVVKHEKACLENQHVELILGKSYSGSGHVRDVVDKLISSHPDDFCGYLAKQVYLPNHALLLRLLLLDPLLCHTCDDLYESIDSAFARFNTIITSLKALDEGRFVRPPRNNKKTFQRSRGDKNGKSDRKCFRCGNPNHLIGECLKPPKDKNQRAFIGGSCNDSGEEDDEKVKDETCLVAHASSEVYSESSYFSDENSSIDDLALDNEYDKLCKMSLKIITKNKRAILGKTPYELLRCRKPMLDYLRVFGSKCFILNTKEYLTKFDPESYEGVFLGYSQNSKAYIVLNKQTKKVEESLSVTFDETPPISKTSPLVDDKLDVEEAIKVVEKKNLENDIVDETLEIDEIVNIKESRNHPLENVIGNLNQRTLGSQAQNQSNFFCFISIIEPKNVNEALGDESWIVAMQEELNQF